MVAVSCESQEGVGIDGGWWLVVAGRKRCGWIMVEGLRGGIDGGRWLEEERDGVSGGWWLWGGKGLRLTGCWGRKGRGGIDGGAIHTQNEFTSLAINLLTLTAAYLSQA
ncbi:hypothetical protein ACH5RR_004047 [Cinchona calisaya]|uniref:Uncharacterized protein n=1 Tax=Cinchona calisaya TaxID=153742 RepID=A0ABD3AWK8_9GENT